MSTPKSESFWLAMGALGLCALMLATLITALLVIPWRSNFMVFQLPEKAPPPIPIIDFNAAQKAPMPNITPTPAPFDLRNPVLTNPFTTPAPM